MSDSSKEYIRACSLAEMPKRFGKRIEIEEGVEIAIFDIGGTFYAVDNVCPHQKFPMLFEGEVNDCVVTCPMHSWQFDIRTGQCLSGGSAWLATYEVFIENGEIMVEKPKQSRPKWME